MSSPRPELAADLYTDAAILDPYPLYREIRDRAPAVWLSAHGVWAIGRFADVRAALRADDELVSGRGVSLNDMLNAQPARTTLTSDGELHRRRRGVLMKPMMPSALAEVRARVERLAGFFWLTTELPAPDHLRARAALGNTRILDRNGKLLFELPDPLTGRQRPVPLDAIPLALRQATIAVEDASFSTNPGVDARGILRAAWTDLRAGSLAAGGSTITEIGAVKVRGGEVLGEFQTLVNPVQSIPPFIAVLTRPGCVRRGAARSRWPDARCSPGGATR